MTNMLPLQMVKLSPLPMAVRLLFVRVNDGCGDASRFWYEPAASWGFDNLARGSGVNVSLARPV